MTPQAFDADAIGQFLRLLHPQLEAGERVEVCAFNSRGTGRRSQEFFASADEAADFILTLPIDLDIHVGINPRNGRDGTKEGVSRVRVMWADVDYKHFASPGEARTLLESFELAPNMIVETGGGLHVYWFLDPPLDAGMEGQRIEGLLRRLYRRLGDLDPVQDLGRIFRVAGTYNNKPEHGSPRLVTFAEASKRRYSLEEFGGLLPPLPAASTTQRRAIAASAKRVDMRGAEMGSTDGVPSLAEMRHMLSHIDPCLPYDDYLAVWMGVASAYPGEAGMRLIDEWSSQAREENGQACSPRTRPRKHFGFRRNGYTVATVIHYAQQGGYRRVPPLPTLRGVRYV